MRDLLTHIPQGDKSLVAPTVRTIFAQPSRRADRTQVHQVGHILDQHWPKAAVRRSPAEQDILAYISFPHEH